MPYISGEELLQHIIEQYPEVAVIIISGMNQVETAVSCMNAGAFYFFVKTVDEQRLVKGVRNAIAMLELQRENLEIKNRFLTDKLEFPEHFENFITQNQTMRSIFQYIGASISEFSNPTAPSYCVGLVLSFSFNHLYVVWKFSPFPASFPKDQKTILG